MPSDAHSPQQVTEESHGTVLRCSQLVVKLLKQGNDLLCDGRYVRRWEEEFAASNNMSQVS